jgi:acylphosphatase
MNCIRAIVSGRVQGVFFRDSTRRKARHLGIAGHAINLPDGRVEVLACGDAAALEQLVAWLHEGPELARVSRVTVEAVEPAAIPRGFTIG